MQQIKKKPFILDAESKYLLQNIDCNCNDCKFMERNIEKYKSFDHLHVNEKGQVVNAFRCQYGKCTKFDKEVSFLPNTCQVYTQDCFVHRKEIK